MDFTERLDMYVEAKMITEDDKKDVNKVIKMFHDRYGAVLTEENADMFIAHLCAAYGRNKTHEEIPPLDEASKKELLGLPSYQQSVEILNSITAVTDNQFNDIEKDYVLLHLNNLIAKLKEDGEWETKSSEK
jgi:hypothetical protein